MRHGGRAHFARFHFLLEIAQRNIAPHIAVEINQNGVDARDGLEKFRHIIMRLDLDGVGVERKPQAALHKGLAMRFPIHIGISHHVRIVIAHRAVDFAQKFLRLDLADLALQAIKHIGDFLAQRGGGGRLAVGAAHHRHRGQIVRQRLQLGGDFGQMRQQHLLARLLQHQRVGKVVDVFAGAGKMNEFAGIGHFRHT